MGRVLERGIDAASTLVAVKTSDVEAASMPRSGPTGWGEGEPFFAGIISSKGFPDGHRSIAPAPVQVPPQLLNRPDLP
jgi:hypothetical protein